MISLEFMFKVFFMKNILFYAFRYYLVVSCRNLPKMDTIGLSDPYVVLELLPTSYYNKPVRVYTTKVKKNTLNPEYNEFFKW